MQESYDVEKYLKYYMEHICVLGRLQIDAIKNLAKYKGQGSEYVSCSYDPDDEDYKEGYVVLFFWKPAAEQDTMVYVDNYKFYKSLVEIVDKFIKEDSKLKDDLAVYIEQIKYDLKIKK